MGCVRRRLKHRATREKKLTENLHVEFASVGATLHRRRLVHRRAETKLADARSLTSDRPARSLHRFSSSLRAEVKICFLSAPRLWLMSSATHSTVSGFFDALPYLPLPRSCRWLLASAQTPPSSS